MILHAPEPKIQPGNAAISDLGPWSVPALTRRALNDLATIAQAMRDRQRDADEILLALQRQANLHRQLGADLDPEAVVAIVRQLPGVASWEPFGEWRRRACTLADWLTQHAGTASAESAVRAVESNAADLLRGGVECN